MVYLCESPQYSGWAHRGFDPEDSSFLEFFYLCRFKKSVKADTAKYFLNYDF